MTFTLSSITVFSKWAIHTERWGISMNEKFSAEFTPIPILIVILPAYFLISLWLGAVVGILWTGLIFASPLLVVMRVRLAAQKKTRAIVFADAFEFSTSLTSKSVRRIEASKIESVDFRESLIGRSSWGSVTVRGAGIRALKIQNVRTPEKLADAIRSIASSPISKTATKQSSDLASSIQELNKLKNDGLITEEEFNKAKSKILGN